MRGYPVRDFTRSEGLCHLDHAPSVVGGVPGFMSGPGLLPGPAAERRRKFTAEVQRRDLFCSREVEKPSKCGCALCRSALEITRGGERRGEGARGRSRAEVAASGGVLVSRRT